MKFWNAFNTNRKLFSTLHVDDVKKKKKIDPLFFCLFLIYPFLSLFLFTVTGERWSRHRFRASIPWMFTRLRFAFHVRREMQTRVYEMAHNGMESKLKNLRRRFEAKVSFEFTREYGTRITHLSKIYFPFDLISLLYYFISRKNRISFVEYILFYIYRWKEVSQDCTETRVLETLCWLRYIIMEEL